MKSKTWIDTHIEDPLKEVVKLLRDNGFNTVCSCGHYPKPYIQLEWYDDQEITKLYNFLVENGYNKTIIRAYWDIEGSKRHLEINFCIKMPLAKLEDIKFTRIGETSNDRRNPNK